MQSTSPLERAFNYELLRQPAAYENRYTHAAKCDLTRSLFRSLTRQRDDYLRLLFPQGPPSDRSKVWSLRSAQGAVDGAEYTEAARGTACGHIFKSGESTYHCKTCAADDTCVLCARCFDASDHDGHMVFISVSPGNSGCCDCGDAEAWRREAPCTIHTARVSLDSSPRGKEKVAGAGLGADLPADLVEAIRMTISRSIDYLCDVLSCSPEQMRLPKTEVNIRTDEVSSRLSDIYGTEPLEAEPEFALLLWNDEKHTVDDVQNQVARACSKPRRFGKQKAWEVNDVGRSIIEYSSDVGELLRMAEVIEHIKVTVTIRSARDTFREQMCETIIEWIADIAGCSVGKDPHILRDIVCQELLNPWRAGSQARNKDIGTAGIDDHETEENLKLQRRWRTLLRPFQPAANVVRVELVGDDMQTVEDVEDNDNENEEDDDDDDIMTTTQEMDIDSDDIHDFRITGRPLDAEMDIDFLDDNDDASEALEATYAGYPPPPPPPRYGNRQRIFTPTDSEDGDVEQSRPGLNEPYGNVPRTPKVKGGAQRAWRPSQHWLEKPAAFKSPMSLEPCEDLWQRVRLDFLILYDLRLWKILRINLRHLYITTVVTIPHFKRLLGLRFAGLYTALAQLYLIADREPDHSIINLSVQMLTTPTITHEVVERGNFLTNLMSILYTFLTTRQVDFPERVSPKATLAFDAGAVTNRRMFRFFLDLRWLLQSEYIHHQMRTEQRYLLQFLDLVKLHQGVCPNLRATGEHVEYESEAWVGASMIVKEINKLCKQVAMSLESDSTNFDDDCHLQRAIRTVAQVVMINSYGHERKRFYANELKEELRWHVVGPFEESGKTYIVPGFVVQSQPMSFHHPLHYLLSWLIENAKSKNREAMRALLFFLPGDLKDPWHVHVSQLTSTQPSPDGLLSAIFDHPLRVCAWLAQMKAGMWVRNGVTLRHQAHTYRSVLHRDVSYQRDIFMVQAGFVLCGSDTERPGERYLAQMIDRFQMETWFKGDYSIIPGFDEFQQLDVIEDFFHLLVVALSERGSLNVASDAREQQDRLLQHDIAHALCFKPMSFSDLTTRVTEKVGESDDFNRVLESMTNYRPPEGLNDTGTFELKSDFIELVDPFYAHYSRNHREEAESIYRKHIASKRGINAEDVVYEPALPPIQSALFASLPAFTVTSLFAQVLSAALRFVATIQSSQTKLQITRIETFLHMVLHLVMIATVENKRNGNAFVEVATLPQKFMTSSEQHSVVSLLVTLSSMAEFASCHAAITHILRMMQFQHPERISALVGPLGALLDRSASDSPASTTSEDKDRKKQQSLARQARIMAQMKQQQNNFLENQGLPGITDDFDQLDEMSTADEPKAPGQRKTWDFPTGTCIWCQEETDDQRLYGTFAYFAQSNILRTTPVIDDPDYIDEVMATPQNLDRSAEDIRPFGVAGNNKHIVEKVGFDGTVIHSERQGLSKGFPSKTCSITAPVATSCGHIMHFSCFELYLQNSVRRHQQQIARNQPETTELKEFICPLCKALGNTFLPVIWKAKHCAFEYELHAAKGFDQWLQELDGTYLVDLTYSGNTPTALSRQQQRVQDFNGRSSQYVSDMFAPPLFATMKGLSLDSSSPPQSSSWMQSPTGGYNLSRIFSLQRNAISPTPADRGTTVRPSAEQVSRMTELLKAYQRIDDTIRVNKLSMSEPFERAGELTMNPIATISRALGASISSYEIARRGVGSDSMATSLLADMSDQTLTHFRVVSETIESYLAVCVLRPSGNSPVTQETIKRRDLMTSQLFGAGSDHNMVSEQEAFLSQDVFLSMVDWFTLIAPSVAEALSVLQLCYWAEVVKVLFIYTKLLKQAGTGHVPGDLNAQPSISQEFARAIASAMQNTDDPSSRLPLSDNALAYLRRVVDAYTLPFLRKCIILMYVRYGLDFECPYNVDPAAPELDRLTALLHLPSLEDMFGFYTGSSEGSYRLRRITRRWILQADLACEQGFRGPNVIALAHPAIFELVGLPKNYDTLTEEAIRRKCPTTNKEITDPAVCLFCGAFFCSQAVCCMKDKSGGGCNQHMKQCGGNVGIFINVRKCMLLFLHGNGNGSFLPAPYLDKHGETDPTLRRHHQLFLNQRRYDKLVREVWLGHAIPAVISRRLEADINPGGFETL